MSSTEPASPDRAPQVEIPLEGGIQPGRVVRIGDTVRRPAGPWSRTCHALMRHLRERGFPAPEPFGFDDAGREVVGWLDGRACIRPWPEALIATEGARAVGTFVRAYQYAAAGFAPASPVWGHGEQPIGAGEIALHGDFAPHNLIWSGAGPCGLIDFELARPGAPIEDAAFCLVRVMPLRDDLKAAEIGFPTAPDRRARLMAFAQGYGAPVNLLLTATRASIIDEIGRIERLGSAGLEPWGSFLRIGLADVARGELDWLEAHAGELV